MSSADVSGSAMALGVARRGCGSLTWLVRGVDESRWRRVCESECSALGRASLDTMSGVAEYSGVAGSVCRFTLVALGWWSGREGVASASSGMKPAMLMVDGRKLGFLLR